MTETGKPIVLGMCPVNTTPSNSTRESPFTDPKDNTFNGVIITVKLQQIQYVVTHTHTHSEHYSTLPRNCERVCQEQYTAGGYGRREEMAGGG